MYIVDSKCSDTSNSENVTFLLGKDANDIITKYREEGISIPLSVQGVVKVKKIFDFKESKDSFDFEDCILKSKEVVNSSLIIEDDTILGILIFDSIVPEEASSFCSRAMKLWGAGGYVERAADKISSAMAMFGYRFAQTFGRYFF